MNKNIIGGIIFSLVLTFSVSNVYSQSIPKKVQKGQEAWRFLKIAQNAYEDKEFGTAVEYAERSREVRKQDAKWQTYVLENTLKKAAVRRAGDSLDRVIPELKELELTEALAIISTHTEKLGADYFKNSYSRVIDYIPAYSHYSEADYLLGKIYRMEGEFELAMTYMKSAYDYADNLDVPMEKYDLLYDLASLSMDLGRKDEFEKYLLLIVKDNEYFGDSNFMRALRRIVDTDNSDSVEKFFLLYRCDNDLALNALTELSEYYRQSGEDDKTMKCSSLASVMAITKLEKIVRQRINDYEYHSLGDLLSKCAKYEDIVKWGNENNIWKLFCNFAESAVSLGRIVFARDLLVILSESEPEDYWKKYAKELLVEGVLDSQV